MKQKALNTSRLFYTQNGVTMRRNGRGKLGTEGSVMAAGIKRNGKKRQKSISLGRVTILQIVGVS
jgi:hypothetical protein